MKDGISIIKTVALFATGLAIAVIVYLAVVPNLFYMIEHGQFFPAILVIFLTAIICIPVTMLLKHIYECM